MRSDAKPLSSFPRGRPWGRWATRSAACVALAAAAAVAALATTPPARASEPAERIRAILEDAKAELARYRERIDRAGYDVAACADALPAEAEALSDFVRDEVAYEPYLGVLRGAAGCLAARSGNALDRALLLKALLEQKGLRARLAFGQLDEERAARLVDAASARGVTRWPPHLDLPYRIGGADLIAERERAHAALAGLVAGRTERLLAALDGALGLLARGREGAPGGLAREVALGWAREHAWVEVEREGTWVAFDPTLGLPPGVAPVAPPQATAEAPPPALVHAVRLRGFCERTTEAGGLAETTLWELERAAADWRGPIALELAAVEDRAGVVDPDAARLVLRAGRRTAASAELPLERGAGARGGAGPGLGAPLGGGGLGGGGLGGGGGRGRDARAPREVTTAVGVEIVVTAPGAEPCSVRRYLLDLVGYARRQSFGGGARVAVPAPDAAQREAAFTRALALAIEAGPVHPAALQRLLLDDAIERAEALEIEGERLYLRLRTGDRTAWLIGQTYFHLVDRAVEGRLGTAGIFPSARVVLVELGRTAEGRERVAFDVTRDSRTFLPGGAVDAYRAELEAGLLASIVEEELCRDPLAEPPAAPFTGSARLLEDALAKGPPAVLGPGAAPPGSLRASPDAKARMALAHARGRRVIVPTAPPGAGLLVGWYELDPATGALEATLENGLHQGMAERDGLERPEKTAGAGRAGNSLRGTMRCMVQNLDGVASIAADAGTGGVGVGTALDAAEVVADCTAKTKRGKVDLDPNGRPKQVRVHEEAQNRHVRGKKGFDEGRGEITADPEELLRSFGQGQHVREGVERVDFGKQIGFFREPGGPPIPTTKGLIHYRKNGLAHVVPARPRRRRPVRERPRRGARPRSTRS